MKNVRSIESYLKDFKYLIYVGSSEERDFMQELCMRSRFEENRLLVFTAGELEKRLYQAKGIVLVGYQDEIFGFDKWKYLSMLGKIKRESIPLAAILHHCQFLPNYNQGMDRIVKRDENISIVASILDNIFIKYISDQNHNTDYD